jgi:long-subunit fatty acid transport protein
MFRNSVEKYPRFASAVLLGVAILLMPVRVSAQQAVIPLQLSFSDPGARSAGLGGAFVALADDATAAFANPAGLVQLVKPEISVEVRNWSYSIPYTVGGRAEGDPSGQGLDVTAGLVKGESTYDTTSLSFLSLVWPIGDWSFAVYRHQYADLEFSGETQGIFGGGSDSFQERWSDQQMHSKQDILSYGLSAAYRFSDKFSVGLGVAYFDVSMEALTVEHLWDVDSETGFFGPTSFLADHLALTEYMFIDDSDWTFSGVGGASAASTARDSKSVSAMTLSRASRLTTVCHPVRLSSAIGVFRQSSPTCMDSAFPTAGWKKD